MSRLGRDPAVGASVMITAITDTGGFFIFLGLATLFLLEYRIGANTKGPDGPFVFRPGGRAHAPDPQGG